MFKDLLTLSRKEQRGLLVLVVLLGLMLLLRIGLPYLYPPVDFSQLVTDSISCYWRTHEGSPSLALEVKDLKAFDPNRVDAEQLVAYGLDPNTASNWIKYLEAGGRFSSPGDIAKLYGMSEEWLTAVMPFITIPKSKSHVYGVNGKVEKTVLLDLNRLDSVSFRALEWPAQMVDSVLNWQQGQWFPKRYLKASLVRWNMDSLMLMHAHMTPKYAKYTGQEAPVLRINVADTAEWSLLRGVGPVLSRRIVNYRKALGGFVQVEQVAEVYGVSPVLFKDIEPYLSLDSVELETIDVNRASLRRLRNHPYMDFYMARAIVEARRANGPFISMEQVGNLEVFDHELWEKLKFYLMIDTSK